MSVGAKDYRVADGTAFALADWPTAVGAICGSKEEYRALLDAHVARLSALQDVLHASGRVAVLLIVQAMDAAGKDGVIKHVMSGVNPQGCRVSSFKQPSEAERQHDFLWRTTRELPERGQIGIFNRSYYEEVLIARVHPELLGVGLPEGSKRRAAFWDERYRSIRGLERHLSANGTRIVKVFLHLSKTEQLRRFLQRIDRPEKNWKFSQADVDERRFWPQYMDAYEACIAATSTVDAPWHVVPADDKRNARLTVSRILLEVLEDLGLAYPETSPARRTELQALRRGLVEGAGFEPA